MKRSLLLLYIFTFFVICTLPVFLMGAGIQSANYENRALAQRPALFDAGRLNLDFPSEFTAFFSDHFGMRSLLVSAWSEINYHVLGDSSNDNVIVGKEGWLFFDKTLDDYLGRNPMTDDELQRLVRTLELQKEYLDNMGIAFVLAVTPNKNSVYGEYMPGRYHIASDESNLKRLYAYLGEKDIPFVNLLDTLTQAKSEQQVYHKKDTHWNNYGALLGYREIMEKIKEQLPAFAFDAYAELAYEIQSVWKGDLEVILMPGFDRRDDQMVYHLPGNYRTERPLRSLEDLDIVTTNNAGEGRLLVFRDSFANALIPFLSNAMGYVRYSRSVPYNYPFLERDNPQAVILQIVERNLPNLLTKAPIIPAPLRQDLPAKIEANVISAEAMTSQQGKYIKLYGWVEDPDKEMAGSEIYIAFENDEGRHIFEPFPILEDILQEQVSEQLTAQRGFSMLLDPMSLPEGAYVVRAVIKNGRDFAASTVVMDLEIVH